MPFKVAVNRCYGGFSLSHAASAAVLTRKGIAFWTVPSQYRLGGDNFVNAPPPPEVVAYLKSGEHDYESPYESWTNEHFISAREFARDDVDMIAVIEEMGEAANGECAHIQIVELPDDVQGRWHIHEYDGSEHIAEDHRTW